MKLILIIALWLVGAAIVLAVQLPLKRPTGLRDVLCTTLACTLSWVTVAVAFVICLWEFWNDLHNNRLL